MIEIEKRYLANYLPSDFDKTSSYYLEDVYLSFDTGAVLRLRRQDDHYMITKKVAVNPGDAASHHEYTIDLTVEEYENLSQASGRRVSKKRYLYNLDGVIYEIGVFDGDLTWLVTIEVEFASRQEFDAFVKPDFCGADVTQELWVLGHMLAGKKYADISSELDRFEYRAIG